MSDRLVVTQGGPLSPEELAAVIVALTPVVHVEEEAADGSGSAGDVPGWGLAALLEGVGDRPATSYADLASRLPEVTPRAVRRPAHARVTAQLGEWSATAGGQGVR